MFAECLDIFSLCMRSSALELSLVVVNPKSEIENNVWGRSWNKCKHMNQWVLPSVNPWVPECFNPWVLECLAQSVATCCVAGLEKSTSRIACEPWQPNILASTGGFRSHHCSTSSDMLEQEIVLAWVLREFSYCYCCWCGGWRCWWLLFVVLLSVGACCLWCAGHGQSIACGKVSRSYLRFCCCCAADRRVGMKVCPCTWELQNVIFNRPGYKRRSRQCPCYSQHQI